MNQTVKYLLLAVLIAGAVAALYYSWTHAVPGDTDPHQHYDLPDYYNGPMAPHGGNAGPAKPSRGDKQILE